MDVAKNRASNNVSFRSGKAIPGDTCRRLKTIQPSGTPMEKLAQAASDKNQVMDELLNQDQIPADYGTQMVALFRDKGQDVLTRDFAVQHIGLYAQALQRRGVYDPASADSRSLRGAACTTPRRRTPAPSVPRFSTPRPRRARSSRRRRSARSPTWRRLIPI